MRYFLLICFLLASACLAAQDTATLFECHRWAIESSPRSGDKAILERMGALRSEQASTGLFPSLTLNGKASYQSDVVTFSPSGLPISIEFPEVSRDQYGINLDISQIVYDGGISRQRKAMEKSHMEAEVQQVEVDLQVIREKVNHLYFNILLLQEQRKSVQILSDQLASRLKVIESAIAQGAAMDADAGIIRVEMLRAEQSLLEIDAGITSLVDALSVLCGGNFQEDVRFEIPRIELEGPGAGLEEDFDARPEFLWLELKEAALEDGKELLSRKRRPVVYAFGQTGYGRPGYNILSEEWDTYYMVGAGITWKLWDWNTGRRDRQLIQHQQLMLRNQKEALRQELQSRCLQERALAERYKMAMEMEEEVLKLQSEVTRRSETELANGTITVTDYVTQLSKENLSRINLATDRIKLAETTVNYQTIKGNL